MIQPLVAKESDPDAKCVVSYCTHKQHDCNACLVVQMVLETKSGLEGAVIGGGHSVAASRLDAQRSVAGWVSEQMGGLSYLFYIRDLVSGLITF